MYEISQGVKPLITRLTMHGQQVLPHCDPVMTKLKNMNNISIPVKLAFAGQLPYC